MNTNTSNTSPMIQITGVAIGPRPNSVSLTYSSGTNAPANNNGNVVETEGQGAGLIAYQLSDGLKNEGWLICGFCVSGLIPADMTIGCADSSTLQVTDAANDPSQESLSFRMLLTNDGGTTVYTSQDPVVTNEPNKG